MSYLNSLRLHFAGRFQAAISTVNNRGPHFDNANFDEKFWEREAGGGFNPRGSADWRLIGCLVTGAWMADGIAVASDDPILRYLIADTDHRTAAKLVDLDPQQQLVSQIWGLEVRIDDAGGTTLLRGHFEPVAFTDMWNRAAISNGDMGFGAMYQSVLSNLTWGNVEQSPFLQQMRVAASDGLLSIKFNVDGISVNCPQSPEFLHGRIVGSIGPATAAEPRHFVLGRQFMSRGSPTVNYCVAVINQELGKIYLDLGNALQTQRPGAALANPGNLSLFGVIQGPSGVSPLRIDDIPYTEAGWYERTAGVSELPMGRRLTDAELQAISNNPLALVLTPPNADPVLAIAEPPSGLFVQADQFVFRLNPGETAEVRLFATHWGQRYPGARIMSVNDPSQLQTAGVPHLPGEPTTAIEFPSVVIANAAGQAILPIRAKDPGKPREYIDGQVYGVRPILEETLAPDVNYPFNSGSFISLLVWSAFQADEPPTWHGSIEPILTQYANLYPVMQQFLDLSNYDAVCANRHLLLLAFGLDVSDPNSMPVTRDLSAAKRRTILRWLSELGPDDKPRKGTPPPPPSAAVAIPSARAQTTEPGVTQMLEGGKTAAMRQRLILRNPTINAGLFKQK